MDSAAINEELICAVCRDVFVEPVTLPCGHNYCNECVNQLKKSALGTAARGRSHYTCPLCLAPCETEIELKRNVVLHNIIEKIYQQQLQSGANVFCSVCKGQQRAPAEKTCVSCGESYCSLHIMPHLENKFFLQHVLVSPTTETNRLCRDHGKELELYCKTDSTPLCVYCMLPSETKHLAGHDVVKLAEARHIVKEECLDKLGNIKENLSQVQRSLQKLDETASCSKDALEKQQQGYIGFLKKVKLFIDIEEKAWEKRFSVAKLQESSLIKYKAEKLEQLQTKLQEAVSAMEKALSNQDPVTLLQLLKNVAWNDLYQKGFCTPKIQEIMKGLTAEPDGSKRRIPLFNSLRGTFSDEEITLDPKTAHPQLKINNELNAVVATREQSTEEPDCERSSSWFCVLGAGAFSTGLHCWEVTVRGLPSWAVGVAYRSISRDPPDSKLGSNDKAWALSYSKSRQHFCAQHNLLMYSFSVNKTPDKIGLFLDNDSGVLSFYDADLLECLYTFYCSFKAPVYPAFCPRFEKDTEFVTEAMRVRKSILF